MNEYQQAASRIARIEQKLEDVDAGFARQAARYKNQKKKLNQLKKGTQKKATRKIWNELF